MSRTQPPPMEKNQKEMGMTLSLLRSEAIHCTRKRLKKKPCPRNPMHSQNCSVVIISASLNPRRRCCTAFPRAGQTAAHLTGDEKTPQEFSERYTASVGPEITAKTRAPLALVTVCTQPGGRRA